MISVLWFCWAQETVTQLSVLGWEGVHTGAWLSIAGKDLKLVCAWLYVSLPHLGKVLGTWGEVTVNLLSRQWRYLVSAFPVPCSHHTFVWFPVFPKGKSEAYPSILLARSSFLSKQQRKRMWFYSMDKIPVPMCAQEENLFSWKIGGQ